MPLLSFYLITVDRKGRFRRVWLHSVDCYPTDWLEWKMILEEVMAIVYYEHNRSEATVSAEKHLRGKFFLGFREGYVQSRINVMREYEAIFDLEFNPNRQLFERVTVKKAQFGPHIAHHVREDYWWMERGIRWRIPPLIPQQHKDPLDWKSMMMEPTSERYVQYSITPNPIYDLEKRDQKPSYGDYENFKGTYSRRPQRKAL